MNEVDPKDIHNSNILIMEGFGGLHEETEIEVGDHIRDPFGNEFEVIELLGSGQFGQVFCVILRNTHEIRKYAMKVTKPQPEYRNQAKRELEILQEIRNKFSLSELHNVVLFMDWFLYRDRLIIIMELLSENLYQVLQKREFFGVPLFLVQSMVKELLSVLIGLKRLGIIHTDIKPENILLVQNSNSIKLIDFGSASYSKSVSSGQALYYIQSRYYRAPEVMLHIPYDCRIDVWSVGCVAFEMFLGIPLFPGQSERSMLDMIVTMLGRFPVNVVQNSPLREYYFDEEGSVLKEPDDPSSFSVTYDDYFVYSTLNEIVHNYTMYFGDTLEEIAKEQENRGLFLNFLYKALTLDHEQRPFAEELLNDPFLVADLQPKSHS